MLYFVTYITYLLPKYSSISSLGPYTDYQN